MVALGVVSPAGGVGPDVDDVVVEGCTFVAVVVGCVVVVVGFGEVVAIAIVCGDVVIATVVEEARLVVVSAPVMNRSSSAGGNISI